MSQTPLLEARGIGRKFGHVQALDGADFTVYAGEICALIGDNGAGKSTLVKILSGADRPDAGELLLDGRRIMLDSPVAAQQAGIATVYQDLALAPELTPSDNLYMGRELMRPGLLGRIGIVDRPRMRARAREQFARLGVTLRASGVPVASLSGGQRQSVAIARAAMWADKVIFMDEPTAALGVVQTARVLELIRQVKAQGIAVVLVSHNMPQVLAIADRIEVMRLGRRVAQLDARNASFEQLVSAMTGGADAQAAGLPA
ncbi:ATP-binding cassette domain-containing protein [Acidisoma cladoniae]|uniref:ATP-binding cassette domain-containing protein n=1 Tax=Acidisoma cladoniae TaxID=3040935 RepID=UPI00254ADFE0|nr:ATP-binding cassette domain-containing protein [Acidisoma sp. PAMC 29798]